MRFNSVQVALNNGLDALPFAVSDRQRQQFLDYLTLLNHWNKTHNLTAVRDPMQQVSRHILDSLAVVPYLGDIRFLADIGSGAGLPALMLAIMRPDVRILAIEKNKKKVAFMRQAAFKLDLPVVDVLSLRVEDWRPPPMDVVISRALASIDKFVALTAHLGNEKTRWLIMKAREREELHNPQFILSACHNLTVPLLPEKRTLIELKKKQSQENL